MQSSWTKRAVEVDSPEPESPCDQIVECPDSTCAQVVHSNAETSGNKLVPVAKTREHQEKKEELGIPEGIWMFKASLSCISKNIFLFSF